MFKKKLLAITLAASLMTAMIPTGVMATEATPAWNTNGGQATVEGGIYSVDPIIEVELPGDLEFGINPLYLDADGDGAAESTQIVSGQYTVINYSNIDVLVTAKTTATAADGVTLLSAVAVDDNSGELTAGTDTKNVFLAQMLPTEAATVNEDGTVKLNTTALSVADGVESTMAGLSLNTAQTVSFILSEYDYTNDKLLPACVSGFVFDGAVDPNAAFAEGDITVQTVFTLNTLSDNQYTKSYEVMKYNSNTGSFDATVVTKKTT